MEFRQKRKRDIRIDITPIVDTVFNLLIFFALSLNFTFNSSIDLNLPTASSVQSTGTKQQETIQITHAGKIFFKQSLVDKDTLTDLLKQLKSKNPACTIIIQADEAVTHGTVVSIMDRCKQAGFAKISIAAHLKDSP